MCSPPRPARECAKNSDRRGSAPKPCWATGYSPLTDWTQCAGRDSGENGAVPRRRRAGARCDACEREFAVGGARSSPLFERAISPRPSCPDRGGPRRASTLRVDAGSAHSPVTESASYARTRACIVRRVTGRPARGCAVRGLRTRARRRRRASRASCRRGEVVRDVRRRRAQLGTDEPSAPMSSVRPRELAASRGS